MVRARVEAGTLALHGWHYVIEDGEIHVFDVNRAGLRAGVAGGQRGHRTLRRREQEPRPQPRSRSRRQRHSVFRLRLAMRSIPIQPRPGPTGGIESPSAPRARLSTRHLLLAPHRLGFFAGTLMLLLSAFAWTGLLLAPLAGVTVTTAMPPTLLHGMLLAGGFMPLFMAGFMFTAGPRWLDVAAPPAARPALAGAAALLGRRADHRRHAGRPRGRRVRGAAARDRVDRGRRRLRRPDPGQRRARQAAREVRDGLLDRRHRLPRCCSRPASRSGTWARSPRPCG